MVPGANRWIGQQTGKTPEQGVSFFEKVSRFYNVSSAIVHNSRTKKQTRPDHKNFEQARSDGWDICLVP